MARRNSTDMIQRPPLRPDIWTPDQGDPQRVEYARALWHSQDNLFIRRDRQIEENIRMLAGQQWAMFSKMLGRFVDISHWFTDREKRWRQRPVFNQLLGWFMLTHARLTENPPIIAFQPSTGDRSDAELAEVMDTIFKTLWNDTGMLEVIDRIASWLVPGGSVYWKTIVDPNIGDILEWKGRATLEMEGADGGMIRRTVEDAPFDQNGQVQAHLTGEGDEWEPFGKAFREYEGGLKVEVLSALQVRGQWSNMIPWHEKRLHMVRSFMTQDEVHDRFGMDVEADATSSDVDRTNALRRVMMGSGFFGAIENLEEGLASFDQEGARGYVDILEVWEAPSQFPGMQRGVEEYEEPGGRLLTVTRTKVLRDGQRPAPYRYTSPVRHLPFVNLPGRPQGTSPQDSLNPQQRTYNRRWAQVIEHANLMTNPVGIVDKGQGLQKGDITDEPGQFIYVNRKPGKAPPLEYASPPPMGEDSWRTLAAVKNEFQDAGNLEGNTGRAPTRGASGELVKELRFNEDRYIAATSRRFALALGRMTEDWIVTLPYIWSQKKTLAWAGEDQVLRTVIVTPDLFEKGKVNVMPDAESMLPEGRGERQNRIAWMWTNGAFGAPDSDQAIRKYLQLSRFPHMGRAVRPGGAHLIMAETENGRLAQGGQALTDVPIFEWQDHELHLSVHEEFMAGPDYQKLSPEIQQQFYLHWTMHRQALLAALQIQMGQEGQKRVIAGSAAAAAAGEVQEVEAEVGPEVPSEGGEGADPDTAVA